MTPMVMVMAIIRMLSLLIFVNGMILMVMVLEIMAMTFPQTLNSLPTVMAMVMLIK